MRKQKFTFFFINEEERERKKRTNSTGHKKLRRQSHVDLQTIYVTRTLQDERFKRTRSDTVSFRERIKFIGQANDARRRASVKFIKEQSVSILVHDCKKLF